MITELPKICTGRLMHVNAWRSAHAQFAVLDMAPGYLRFEEMPWKQRSSWSNESTVPTRSSIDIQKLKRGKLRMAIFSTSLKRAINSPITQSLPIAPCI